MAASQATVRDILAIVKHYVKPEDLRQMFTELARVEGNKSFRATVVALQREYERTK